MGRSVKERDAVDKDLVKLLRRPVVLPGQLKLIPVADPAAYDGVGLSTGDWLVQVPVKRAWEVLGLSWQLQTSAVVGNRFPILYVKDPAKRIVDVSLGSSFAASQVGTVGLYALAGSLNGNVSALSKLGRLWVPGGGYLVGTLLTSGAGTALVPAKAGDQASSVGLYVREYTEQDFQLVN